MESKRSHYFSSFKIHLGKCWLFPYLLTSMPGKNCPWLLAPSLGTWFRLPSHPSFFMWGSTCCNSLLLLCRLLGLQQPPFFWSFCFFKSKLARNKFLKKLCRPWADFTRVHSTSHSYRSFQNKPFTSRRYNWDAWRATPLSFLEPLGLFRRYVRHNIRVFSLFKGCFARLNTCSFDFFKVLAKVCTVNPWLFFFFPRSHFLSSIWKTSLNVSILCYLGILRIFKDTKSCFLFIKHFSFNSSCFSRILTITSEEKKKKQLEFITWKFLHCMSKIIT